MAPLLHIPPIVERELRVASRRPTTYWNRLGAGAIGVATLMWLLGVDQAVGGTGTNGVLGFRTLAIVSGCVLVLSTLQLASAAMAREKSDDTLGLLFLTPLSVSQIILGKLVSTCLGSLYRFLALVPVLALTMLLGGVSLQNFLWFLVGLFHLVFLAASLGLYLSAKSWDEHRALTSTTVYFLGMIIISPSVANVVASYLKLARPDYLFALSPAFAVYEALFSGFNNSRLTACSLVWTQFLGWFLLYRTYRILPLCWQQRPDLSSFARALSPSARTTKATAISPTKQLSPTRHHTFQFTTARLREKLQDGNPVTWLASRRYAPSVRAWTIGAIAFVGCLYAVDDSLEALLSPRLALFLLFCINAAVKCHIQAQASYAWARDQEDNTLSLLLYAPISPHQLIQGHLEALSPLRRLILPLLALEAIWLTVTLVWNRDEFVGYRLQQVLRPALALWLVMIPDLYASAWVGLRQSVLCDKAVDASRETFNQVMVIPWILVGAYWVSAVVAGGRFSMAIGFIAIPYLIISLAIDAWLIYQARRDLPWLIPLATTRRAEDVSVSDERWRILGRRLGQWWARRKADRRSPSRSR